MEEGIYTHDNLKKIMMEMKMKKKHFTRKATSNIITTTTQFRTDNLN